MATTILTRHTLVVPTWLNIADIHFEHVEHVILSFKRLPVADLCLANGLREGQFIRVGMVGDYFVAAEGVEPFIDENANDKLVALALLWVDQHSQGEFTRSWGYAPIRHEFEVASNINLALSVPKGLDFSALNLKLRAGGLPRFNDLALQLLCLKNGIDYVRLRSGPVSDITDLLFSWYTLHRRTGGVPHRQLEGVIRREATVQSLHCDFLSKASSDP